MIRRLGIQVAYRPRGAAEARVGEGTMETIDQVVGFLEAAGALQPGKSPWPQYKESNGEWTRHRIDWPKLVGSSQDSGEKWPHPTEDIFDDVARRLDDRKSWGDPSKGELIEMAGRRGWDTCAWYQPIHYFGRGWGIFIQEDCVYRACLDIARFLPHHAGTAATVASSLLLASLMVYFLHEHYHHKVECLGIRLHVIDRRSSYLPYDALVYRPNVRSDEQLEEALANADAYLRLSTSPYGDRIGPDVRRATRDYLKKTFPYDPPGYSRADRYLDWDRFDDAENELKGRVHEHTLRPSQPSSDWAIATRLMQSMGIVTDNIWVVVRAGSRSVFPVIYP